jgi:hypothetical protein
LRISEETLVYDAKVRNKNSKKNRMLNPDQKILIEFVEDRAARLSIRKRIKVYRGLADFIDDKSVANPLVKKAQILEDAESKCAQLNLKFQ